MANNIFYDKDFFDKSRGLDKESLVKLITGSAGDAEIKVLTNTKSTIYFVIPTNQIGDQLGSIQAAGFNTVGCIGSFGTGGTLCMTASSISSAGSVSTG